MTQKYLHGGMRLLASVSMDDSGGRGRVRVERLQTLIRRNGPVEETRRSRSARGEKSPFPHPVCGVGDDGAVQLMRVSKKWSKQL